MIKKQIPGSFVSVDVSRSTRKSKFFHQINAVIDWTVFEKECYKVCKRSLGCSRQVCLSSLGAMQEDALTNLGSSL
jgi:hypothetical protein